MSLPPHGAMFSEVVLKPELILFLYQSEDVILSILMKEHAI